MTADHDLETIAIMTISLVTRCEAGTCMSVTSTCHKVNLPYMTNHVPSLVLTPQHNTCLATKSSQDTEANSCVQHGHTTRITPGCGIKLAISHHVVWCTGPMRPISKCDPCAMITADDTAVLSHRYGRENSRALSVRKDIVGIHLSFNRVDLELH